MIHKTIIFFGLKILHHDKIGHKSGQKRNLIKRAYCAVLQILIKYTPAAATKSDVIFTTAIIIDVRGGVTCAVLRVKCSIDSGVLVSLSFEAIIRHQRDFK